MMFVLGLFIRSIFALPQLILSAMRRLDVEVKAIVVATITNVILNFLLIPRWGINGAAFASLVSFIIWSAVIFYYSRKIFAFKFHIGIYRAVLGGLAALVILFLFKEYVLVLIDAVIANIQISIPSGQLLDEIAQELVKLIIFGLFFLLSVFIYFITLLFLKSFGEEEISLLAAGLRKVGVPERYINWCCAFLEVKWLKIS